MKPNILLIHSDQHRYDCVGAHRLRPDVATPRLDRLAAEGTRFSRAFSTVPICTPARASLLTGAWPTTHGCFCIPTAEINRAARTDLPTVHRLLHGAGYRIAWTGKFHGEQVTGPGEDPCVEDYVSPGDYRPPDGPGRRPTPLERPNGYFGDPEPTTDTQSHALGWQADQVIRQITERREAPFFIRWDPPEPHLPCNPSASFADRFAEAAIPPWPSFPDRLEGKPAAQRRQQNLWGTRDWRWEDWLRTVRLYYAIIAEMDHHIGRVLDALERLGLAENTLVIYSSDHGDYCGGHSQMDKHFAMYEDLVRVPLILRWPGKLEAGSQCEAFASNSIDIARTLLAAADVDAPETFVGQDLTALATGRIREPRPYAFSQYFGTESGAYSLRMLRDERYKFVYHPVGDRHEFYDLESDPGEQHNRIDDPALADDIRRLKYDLWETMSGIGDRLANRWTRLELQAAKDPA
ncbi:MAG: sulfatase-like hydrolase/transferase [Opitutales bacterium]